MVGAPEGPPQGPLEGLSGRSPLKLPHGSLLCPSGIPSQCAFTPFWSRSFRSGGLLGSRSGSHCSVVYRGRAPEPSSLLCCYLGGFKLHDKALPLGGITKSAANPLLEVEVVNAVGVCHFHQLLTDHPLAVCAQPCCCCCSARLPTDPDPYGLSTGDSKKATAAAAAAAVAAGSRHVTVLEELLPYEALQEATARQGLTPVLVLPCGLAHSAIELVAVNHSLEDVFYSTGLPKHSRGGACKGEPSSTPLSGERSEGKRQDGRARHFSDSSDSDNPYLSNSSDENSETDSEEESVPRLSEWEASMRAAGCSLGLEGRRLAELHPHTFQWTRGEGHRLRSEGSVCCERDAQKGSSCCCSTCCWCPMGKEADCNGGMRNIYSRGEARHAPDLLDTLKPKESNASERLLEVQTDDKHPFIKLIYARNSRGFYVARLQHNEEGVTPEEAQDFMREIGRRHQRRGDSPEPFTSAAAYEAFRHDGGLKRQLEIQVLHDAPYGYRVPLQEGGLARYKDRESGSLRFNVPKQLPAHPSVINIAVSPAEVGEAALLYSSQFVSLWKAEEARMQVEVPLSLSVVTRNIKRSSRPSMRYRHRVALADPATESFQTLCYLPNQRQTLLLGSENLWALDLRAKGMTRQFPALHAPTHGSSLQCVAETFYAPCTANSSYHTAFTALAPHPTHSFLLAAAHDATECVSLFDLRAMHEPLTVVALPSLRKMGSRYRSLIWHSSCDQSNEVQQLDFMRATQLTGSRACAVAAAAAAPRCESSSCTHDLLAAFSWRSEDVVCSSFRVHPAFYPCNPLRSSPPASSPYAPRDAHIGKAWNPGGTPEPRAPACMHEQQTRPNFGKAPLETIRRGCLPTAIQREVLEVSWQAEICMFPRISWNLEHRERCSPISSRTPLGSSWTAQPPLQVTVDEPAATSTFHGFAGACLFSLPLTQEARRLLLNEGQQVSPSHIYCSSCGSRNLRSLPKSAAGAGMPQESFCRRCAVPLKTLGAWSQGPTGTIAVLGALTTSGRLTCRPLTLNDPLLQIKMHRRYRLYGTLARRQRRLQEAVAEEGPAAGIPEALQPISPPEALGGALLSFHAPRRSERLVDTPVDDESVETDSSEPLPGRGKGAIDTLLLLLQGSRNESRVLPQRISALLLQAQLQQSLQREMLLRDALRWKRRQQLLLMMRAQVAGCLGPFSRESSESLMQLLRQGLEATALSVQWPRKLSAFSFCDSGAFGVHKPAFLTEAYDPEPIVQMLLAHTCLDKHLHCYPAQPLSEEGSTLDSASAEDRVSKGVTELVSSGNPQGQPVRDTRESRKASCSLNSSVSSHSSHSEEDDQQRALSASAAKMLLEGKPMETSFTPQTEVSALPFPTARSRAVFRYAVEAVEALSYTTTEKSLLQLRDEGTVLLQDIMVAIQLWRDKVLEDSEVLALIRPFTVSRPCSTGLLDMQRTTLPLVHPLPASPQEAVEAALGTGEKGRKGAHTCRAVNQEEKGTRAELLAGDSTISGTQPLEEGLVSGCMPAITSGKVRAVFRKAANPAVAPALPCFCSVLMQHHCDLHSCVQGKRTEDWIQVALGDSLTRQYPQTDGLQALLHVLKAEYQKWLAMRPSPRVLRDTCFLPQATVDELAEALFLTHEVLLLPETAYKSTPRGSCVTNAATDTPVSDDGDNATFFVASAEKSACGSLLDSARGLGGTEDVDGSFQGHHQLDCTPKGPPHSRNSETSMLARNLLCGTNCPVESPWLPAYCVSRHMHVFVRRELLLSEDDELQHALQQRAWPDLLQQQEREQAAAADHAFGTGHCFTPYPSMPCLQLPQSMQTRLPDHVVDGLVRSKWGRLLCGIAINDVLIADLLRHWEVSAVQRLRESREEQREKGAELTCGKASGVSRSEPSIIAESLANDAPGPVADEIRRLLLLLPESSQGFSLFASVQTRQQQQRRAQAERQQLLDSIARAMLQ
ncbi:uncharacterized protein LOC34619715 [Cyclospora cayetanensis]|uniref:Uncharacterized protein LOC34619715 n=1 Tax=Cyclospora cayetanensis TaxID=88456 RepID=A0A6P6RTW7_9EIME|nr:uncharacterized protein LOC34619715 [Cyclospora cayetanensis]